ncbi:MAG TPA: zinc ribbon domain-containing protein [Nitrososphaerales archaeon]|nr:zinc ribbon domain-containing protein [Nitrososphaerales archaeon]
MAMFSGERVERSAKATLLEPTKTKGQLYLTERRLAMVRKEGLIRKKEVAVFDLPLGSVSFARTEGLISKKLIVAASSADGRVLPYKIEVGKTKSWSEAISNLKRGPAAPGAPMPPSSYQQYQPAAPSYQQYQTPAVQPPAGTEATKYCIQCGERIPSRAGFCPRCGQRQ